MLTVAQAAQVLGLTSARIRQMVEDGVLPEAGRAGNTILLHRVDVTELLREGWPGRRSAGRVFSPKSGGFGPDVFPVHRPLRGGGYFVAYAETEDASEQLSLDLLSTIENLKAEDPPPHYVLHAARADDTASIVQASAGFRDDPSVRKFLHYVRLLSGHPLRAAVQNLKDDVIWPQVEID